MSKPKEIVPVNCPYCGGKARHIVGLGNHWIGCHKKCPGSKLIGISRREFYAIREWNTNVAKAPTPSPSEAQ